MSEYFEKLKDPRWQKKRLAVFERDGFQCLCCEDKTSTLHVHHLIYTAKEPWDEPMENLETLCAECHEFRESFNVKQGGRSCLSTKICQDFEWVFVRYFASNQPKYKNVKSFSHFMECAVKFCDRIKEVGLNPSLSWKKTPVSEPPKLCDQIAGEGL